MEGQKDKKSLEDLERENAALREQLEEANDFLRAAQARNTANEISLQVADKTMLRLREKLKAFEKAEVK